MPFVPLSQGSCCRSAAIAVVAVAARCRFIEFSNTFFSVLRGTLSAGVGGAAGVGTMPRERPRPSGVAAPQTPDEIAAPRAEEPRDRSPQPPPLQDAAWGQIVRMAPLPDTEMHAIPHRERVQLDQVARPRIYVDLTS